MFILYLVFMLGIGIWFFVRSKDAGEKDYFLGGREMGAWVSGLSAGASDMSAWVLMGMPASIYAYGMGKAWIPVGLFIGYSLSWIFIAPRLRSFSIVCGRLDHDPAVSDEPVQGELPRAADHLRGDLPRGVYRLFREQHQSVRHAL